MLPTLSSSSVYRIECNNLYVDSPNKTVAERRKKTEKT